MNIRAILNKRVITESSHSEHILEEKHWNLPLGPAAQWALGTRSECEHLLLCLHQRHAGVVVAVGVQGRDDLARHWVEHGQRGERPRDLPVLGHVTELFGWFLYSTVVHQLDAVSEGNEIVNTYFNCSIATERILQLLLLL